MSKLFYEDVNVGDELPTTVQNITMPVMQRWVASSETLRRDHYDPKYAIEHDGIPNAVMSGSWSQAYIWQLLFNWVGPDGWVLRSAQKNARMVHPGHTLTFFGKVTNKHEENGLGLRGPRCRSAPRRRHRLSTRRRHSGPSTAERSTSAISLRPLKRFSSSASLGPGFSRRSSMTGGRP